MASSDIDNTEALSCWELLHLGNWPGISCPYCKQSECNEIFFCPTYLYLVSMKTSSYSLCNSWWKREWMGQEYMETPMRLTKKSGLHLADSSYHVSSAVVSHYGKLWETWEVDTFIQVHAALSLALCSSLWMDGFLYLL